MLRLVATDLDGTLLRRDRTVSERTRRALLEIQQVGGRVVLVTARAPDTVLPIADAAGVSGLVICCNGAIVYDVERDEIVRHTPLALDVLRGLIAALRSAAPGVCFGFRLGDRFAREPAYRLIGEVRDDAVVGDALALREQSAVKLIARHPVLDPDELLARVHALGLGGFEATHSGAPFVEVAAVGVTKAWALESLCSDLGIASGEVVALGDAPNDLPMLRWAGRGIAMANAHPAVLKAADEVAPSNEDDGVAIVLEQILTTLRQRAR